jgi:acyl transferase domain-containing protein/NAD(P)-dependent dehydrogenase (short-subunit alcohol dehydrogenase family)/acyl-CoA thioesterase FadM
VSWFATPYTIHFDDTMAYGSHHFLTAFKLQCAAREALLFGEHVFDIDGVPEALESIRLLTSDAYARNLAPAHLADRLVILVSLEDRGDVQLRFCFRVMNSEGVPVCAGFQTITSVSAQTGRPTPMPGPLADCMARLTELDEPTDTDFRALVLAGDDVEDRLFPAAARQAAIDYLRPRHPTPGLIRSAPARAEIEAWLFAGQGSFDPVAFSERIRRAQDVRSVLDRCATITTARLDGDGAGLLSGDLERCVRAVGQRRDLVQVGIFLQGVLGAHLRSGRPAALAGHSFGEIAAMCVAGCFDWATGVEIVCARVAALARHAPEGGLLAVAANRVETELAITKLGSEAVVIAGRNHRTQTIVSGPTAELESLQAILRASDIQSTVVPSPTSFHHPALGAAAVAWHEALRALDVRGPERLLYSPIGRRRVLPTDDVRAILVSQLLRPFDLFGAIGDLVDAGAEHFVDCSTTGKLARLIATAAPDHVRVSSASADEGPAVEVTATPESPSNVEPRAPRVVIVAAGCSLPAGADSPAALWSALKERRSGVVDLRGIDASWERDFYAATNTPDRSTSAMAGVVDSMRCPPGFDAAAFDALTRTQKLLVIALTPCTTAARADDRILCFVGATADGFEDQDRATSLSTAGLATEPAPTPYDATRSVVDLLLDGRAETTLLDAACASSLYTVALGMRALERGEADAVIAGGVFCPGPGNNCLFSQFGGLTAHALRPFDANADGVAFSEGASFVLLRRLADAERDGDRIAAVVCGAGLSSDGLSPSANVPQSAGQALALERCYAGYDVDPDTIVGVEAHGTSTPVGDATELATLSGFYRGTASPIPVHSLKGLLGHAGWAAGTASVIAACEALANGELPGQSNYDEPCSALRSVSDTLSVSSEPRALPEGPCRIAVDGFGFGGANAHLVVERYLPSSERPPVEARHPQSAPLVVVAAHGVFPPEGRFDRDTLELPKGVLLLPDLAEDMDPTQTLAIAIVHRTLEDLAPLPDDVRRDTSVVLAMSGKTERGLDATLRVLAPRIGRDLDPADAERLADAAARTRTSGPYTLQCMMPNVSAGRAASRLNLKGPNFVVDAGERSLADAFAAAERLVDRDAEHGVRLALVTSIHANRHRPGPEHAVCFAVTTPARAAELGLEVLSELPADRSDPRALYAAVGQAPPDVFPLHRPVWVGARPAGEPRRVRRLVAICPATMTDTLRTHLDVCCDDFLIAIAGRGDTRGDRVVTFDLDDDDAALARLTAFAPDAVVAIQPGVTGIDAALDATLDDRSVHELMFVVARHFVDALDSVALWGLVVGGFEAGDALPASGALSGLLKAIARERDEAQVGVLLTDRDLEPSMRALAREWGTDCDEVERVSCGDGRLVRRLERCGPAEREPAQRLDAQSVVIATGGARGITAVLVEALLEDVGCTVVALGRSELEAGPDDLDDAEARFYAACIEADPGMSPAQLRSRFASQRARWEAHRTVERLRRVGRIVYRAVDVTDPDAVDAAIDDVLEEHGRIDAVIHGAGVQWSKRLEDRTLQELRTTFDVKVQGLSNVVRACLLRDQRVAVHALTSAYSVFGNDGQHDYGAANETLDHLCALASREGLGWTSIGWLAWDGVGMTRGTEYRALQELRGLSGVDEANGKRLFLDVIRGRTNAAIHLPLTDAERVRYGVRTVIARVPVDVDDLPCLTHHLVRGTPTVPGAWSVERMVNAAGVVVGGGEATVRALEFHRFVRVVDGRGPRLTAVVEQDGDDLRVRLVGDVLHASGVVLARNVLFAEAAIARHPPTRYAPEVRVDAGRSVLDPYCADASALELSGPFDCLRNIEIGTTGRSATLGPEVLGVDQGVVPSLVLDAAWRLSGMYADGTTALFAPLGAGRLTLPIGRTDDSSGWSIHAATPTVDGPLLRCPRVEVRDGEGVVRLRIDDSVARRMS